MIFHVAPSTDAHVFLRILDHSFLYSIEVCIGLFDLSQCSIGISLSNFNNFSYFDVKVTNFGHLILYISIKKIVNSRIHKVHWTTS
jgi:hypothetical protein